MPVVVDHPYCTHPAAEEVLWRYMDLGKFLSLLQTGSLHFAAVDSFGDRFEGLFSEADLERAGPLTLSDIQIEGIRLYKGIRPVMEGASQHRARAVLNCWTIQPHEQDTLWDKYQAKVAIKTTWAALRSALAKSPEEIFGSKVTYVASGKFDEFTRTMWADSVYFMKRIEFSGDHEFRLAMIDWRRTAPWDGAYVPVDVGTLLTEVRLRPHTALWEANAIADVMTRYGVTAPVMASSIDGNR